jgi:hypothetical protein
MVCANKNAVYVRELDVFRHKLGLERSSSAYEVASINELYWSLEKFFVERADHDLHEER